MSEARSPIMRAEKLSKAFPDGQVNALVDVDLEILAGDFLSIMGPSGSGKSTLLMILGALEEPTSGKVYFEGKPLDSWGDLDLFRSRKLGFVFQSFHLLPTLTALENVQLPMFETGLSRQERMRKAQRLLELASIGHRAGLLPSKLSIGERQRVAVARALANDPVMLLADEPTGNLDSHTAEEILQLFDNLHREQGMTLVVVTHSHEVAQRAERLILLRDGRVAEERDLSHGDGTAGATPSAPAAGKV
jgi:putative ABC transport system ATP-binding protein